MPVSVTGETHYKPKAIKIHFSWRVLSLCFLLFELASGTSCRDCELEVQLVNMPHYLDPDDVHHRRDTKSSIRGIVDGYIYAARVRHHFHSVNDEKKVDSLNRAHDNAGESGPALSKVWLGLALKESKHGIVEIGFVCHDATYSVDFAVHELYARTVENSPDDADNAADAVADHIVSTLREYETEHMCKFIGAGIAPNLAETSPGLAVRLWAELDVLPIVLTGSNISLKASEHDSPSAEVDETADAMARKCIT